MRLVYADPPYPGKAHLYRENTEVDHVELVAKLCTYDGWALSTDERNLQYVLSLCPERVRVLAWCKPNATPFPHHPWMSWEPVLCTPARPELANLPSYWVGNRPPAGFAGKGFTGSKPLGFCEWVIRCLGAEVGDTLDDLFPGTGVMREAWEKFQTHLQLLPPPAPGMTGRYQQLRRSHDQLPGMPEPTITRERNTPDSNVAP